VAQGGDASDRYLAAYHDLARSSTPREPGWLRESRERSIGRFRELGFPAPKSEEWKYTNLAPLLKTTFARGRPEDPEGVAAERFEAFTFGVLKTSLLVFVNGRFTPRLSYLRYLPRRVRVMSLAEAIEDDPESLAPHLGRYATLDGNPFVALNGALLQDGVFIEVPPRTVVEEPIHALFVTHGDGGPIASYPRNLILLGEASRATVIETYAGGRTGAYLTNAVTEVRVDAAASLGHYKMQREADRGFHMASMSIQQGRDSSVACHSFTFGGSLSRNYVHTLFGGPGGSLVLNGLFMPAAGQQADNYTRIDHAQAACTSVELYKGILDGTSRGVFNGNILVRKDAQKTSARQTNRNLLLSKDAWVDSTPGLEILADDVKCNHASAIGQLDEAAVFYLRSRGIDEEAARNILTYAFAADVINQVALAPVRIKLDQIVLSRLSRGAGPEVAG
jgi:Fe-S cluster assembly protein SufD